VEEYEPGFPILDEHWEDDESWDPIWAETEQDARVLARFGNDGHDLRQLESS
jgi:hypothetical protein